MNDNELLVQLVDEQDNPLGTMNKMEAHRLPALHRAVSVLVFNSAGEELLHLFDFVYRAKVNDELTEHEYDRVFTLTSDALPQPHPDEVDEWRYISPDALQQEMREHPECFTEWFKMIHQKVHGS